MTITAQPLPFYQMPLLSIDAETTGVDPFTDRIVTFSMVVDYLEEGKAPAIKSWLIKPGIEIPAEAAEVHGITNEYAQEHGMEASVALAEIADALNKWAARGLPVVIYNAQFDATLLIAECARYGIVLDDLFTKVIDPYVLDQYLDKWRKGKRQLAVTAKHYGIKDFDAHDATGDSIAAAGIARAIGKKFKLDLTPEQLFEMQVKVKREKSIDLQNYFRNQQGKKDVFIPTAWPFRTVESDAADHMRDPIKN